MQTPQTFLHPKTNDDRNSILAVSPDRNLAHIRQQALSEAGFAILSVTTECAARYEISLGRCGVLLLCHKLKRSVREDLAEYFHQWCPDPRVVSILADYGDSCPRRTSICLLHSDDPSTLIRALRQPLAA